MGEPAVGDSAPSAAPILIRSNGLWAEDKLGFLDRYVPPALTATGGKPARHYVELFAGPGLWQECPGAPKRDGAALRMIATEGKGVPPPTFTHGTFVNLDPDHDASLREMVGSRIRAGECRIPPRNLHFEKNDANAVIPRILGKIGRHDYALVVADFENPSQWPWSSVEAVRACGPESTELYAMMPTHMALIRMMARDRRKLLLFESALNDFFGCCDWQDLVRSARNDRERKELPAKLEHLYCGRLRALGWEHSIVVRTVRRSGEHRLYSMIFATNSPVAKKLVDWEAETKPKPQLSLDLR
jgi:three-Cys-motif partner protein